MKDAPGNPSGRQPEGTTLLEATGPPANPMAGTIWRSPIDGRIMAWIPPGSFNIGSPLFEYGRSPYELQHPVIMQWGFWMDVTEVTNRAYRAFVLANPQWQKGRLPVSYHDGHYLQDWNWNEFPPGTADYPVIYVSWYAARAYAEWAGKRLPNEAEWEYACRAGSSAAFWWGNNFDPSRANNSRQGTYPVGDPARRNLWGLYDMSGNVGEWVSSLYNNYPFRANDGRENLQAGGLRVIRGGAWNTDPPMLRSASRFGSDPTMCALGAGLRCAR
jgi:formylglycine-generating enzyme required for sulfatase activity